MAYDFRTLNYLGSKLRLLDFIEENVRKVTPDDAGVCDLFAGSGCVSYKLSKLFPVVACDIQHYSKVICDALLQPCTLTKETTNAFMSEIKDIKFKLHDAFIPLIELEEGAIKNENLELLTDIVEHGSLEVYNLEKTDENTTADVASYRKSVISVAIKGYGEYKVVACKDKNFYLDYTGKETPEKTPEETPKKEFKTELTYKAFDSDKKEVEGKVTNGVFFPPYYDNDVEKKDADAVATITSKTDEEIISTNGVAMKEDGTANSEGWYYADKNNKKVISKKYPFDTYDNTTDNGKVSEEVKIAGKDGGASTEKPAVEWTFRRVRKTETTNKDGSVTVVIEYNLPVDKSTIPSDWEPVYDNDGKTIHKIKRTIKKGTNYSKDVIVGQNGNKDKKVTTKVEKVWVLPQTGASSAIIIAVIAIAGAGLVIGKSKMKKLK